VVAFYQKVGYAEGAATGADTTKELAMNPILDPDARLIAEIQRKLSGGAR
jgi:hypothetical protein